MSTDHEIMSDDAIEELQRLRLSVEVPTAARRVWDRILSPAERQELKSFKAAFKSTGMIGVWMRLRHVSAEQSVVQLALRLNLTDRDTANWLLRELGEPELGADSPPATQSPSWDRETRRLTFCRNVVRQVPRPKQAYNIVAVLDAFEEQGWPPRIDDPLRNGPDSQRLNRTVEVLNTGLNSIRFHSDGTGEGIAWEPL